MELILRPNCSLLYMHSNNMNRKVILKKESYGYKYNPFVLMQKCSSHAIIPPSRNARVMQLFHHHEMLESCNYSTITKCSSHAIIPPSRNARVMQLFHHNEMLESCNYSTITKCSSHAIIPPSRNARVMQLFHHHEIQHSHLSHAKNHVPQQQISPHPPPIIIHTAAYVRAKAKTKHTHHVSNTNMKSQSPCIYDHRITKYPLPVFPELIDRPVASRQPYKVGKTYDSLVSSPPPQNNFSFQDIYRCVQRSSV